MLRVGARVRGGARRRRRCAERRMEARGGARRDAWRLAEAPEVRGGGEPTGFSAYGVRKSPYLQNKSFLAS